MLSWVPASVRERVNSEFRKRGYPLAWMPPHVISRTNGAIEVSFPLLAAHLMLTTPRPYFIGIGANDGVTHDPLHPFVRDFGWRGIMVEPIPEAFAALQRNYASFRDVALIEAAIGPADGRGTIYSVAMSARDAMTMSLHSSFSRDVLLRGRQWHAGLDAHIIERDVAIMSFATLLETAGGNAVDVLKIDAEGYDLDILRGVDLDRLSPKLILAEHANLSRQGKVEMADILLEHGYRVSLTALDMLGYKESCQPAGGPGVTW